LTPFETTIPLLPDGPILVAVSGGADSVALLNILHRKADKQKHPLIVAHFQHGIRGREAEEDALSVAEMAERLGCPFFRGDGDVPAQAVKAKESLEMTARRLRHTFLQKTASGNGCVAIATGHTADDQIETLFLRLARGTSLRGAGGMHIISPGIDGDVPIIRPLLEVRHKQLCDWLGAESIPWREDASNADCSIQRNRVRNKLIPEFEAVFGDSAAESLVRSMALFRSDNDYLDHLAERELTNIKLSAMHLDKLPVPVFQRVVASLLYNSEIPPQFVTLNVIERVKQLCAGRERGTVEIPLGDGWILRRLGDELQFMPSPIECTEVDEVKFVFTLPAENTEFGPVNFFGSEKPLVLQIAHNRGFMKPARTSPLLLPQFCSVSSSLTGTQLTLRTPLEGDRISPAGSGITQKLSDIFINLKIPRHERKNIPVISSGESRIIWLPGYAVDESAAVRETDKSVYMRLDAWQGADSAI
jgi:tRNA(Ile)-lysidine synthase